MSVQPRTSLFWRLFFPFRLLFLLFEKKLYRVPDNDEREILWGYLGGSESINDNRRLLRNAGMRMMIDG